jgi:hypothetical protein
MAVGLVRRRVDQTLIGAVAWNAAKHVVAYRRELESLIAAA